MLKWLLVALWLIYLVNPFDLLPDMAAGWGWLDDLGLLALLWYFVLRRGRSTPGSGFDERDDAKRQSGRQARPETKTAADPYAVLEISPGASPAEIRKAYRRLAAQYHPDKVAHLGEDLRILAEKKFKAIQAAYDALRHG
jgi:hypothetical protein